MRLAFFALKSFDYVCPFCGEFYGVENVGMMWDFDPAIIAE